jgi:hypothetical protein
MKRHMKPLVNGAQRSWTVALRHWLRSRLNPKAGAPIVAADRASGRRNGLEIAGHTIALLALGKDAESSHTASR